MSIRKKMGFILLCAGVCFCVATYGIQRLIILPGVVSLEQDAAVRDAARVVNAIENEIHHLSSLAWDWAAWDDTCDFVKTGSGDYIASNLVFSTFTGNHLNLLYICDTNGRVIWGKTYDLAEEKEIHTDLFPKHALPTDHPLLLKKGNSTPVPAKIKGILTTAAGPMAVSAAPILTSNETGPFRGTLIMGRFLDAKMALQIATQTQVDFSMAPASRPPAPVVSKKNLRSHTGGLDNYQIEIIDKNLLNVHCVLLDVSGNPAMALTAHIQRTISKKSHEMIHNSVLSIFMACAGILILLLFCLTKTILQPISQLNNHVREIRKTGDLSKRLNLATKDEIGNLADACNDMLARLEQTLQENMKMTAQLQADYENRKKTDEKIQRALRMEALTTLTAGIAHNFNNLLTIMLGSAELAATKIPNNAPVRDLLKRIEKAGIRAKEIVWQLIRFSQRMENNFYPVQLDAIVKKEIQEMESMAGDRVKFIFHLAPDCMPVSGDPDQLHVVIRNLLANAMESVKDRPGVIAIALENITVADGAEIAAANLKKGNYVCLTLRDNGRGIDSPHMERIFDPYFTTKDFSLGAGMGLAVVRGLVINLNGAITVDSQAAKGTVVNVYLPAAAAAGPAPENT